MRTQRKIVHNLDVAPSHITSFSDIVKDRDIIEDFIDYEFSKGSEANELLFSKPRKTRVKKLTLYYEQAFALSLNLQKELRSQGYRFVEDFHPSLLINAMSQLDEKFLTEFGLPWYASILLPSWPIMVFDVDCYFSIQRDTSGKRCLKMHPTDYNPSDCAILVERI